MLIACPSCASEYTIDPAYVRPQGRTVRCAACRDTFFVASEEEPPEGTAAPEGEDEWAQALAEAPAPPINVEARTERTPPAPRERPPARRTRAPHPGLRRLAAGIGLAVAALALLGGAISGRAAVVRAVPETARLYAALGLPVNLRGLDFQGVRSETAGEGAESVLVVEGEIHNPGGAEAGVPLILVTVRGDQGQPLYSWTTEPPRRSLPPGEASRFRVRLAAPPVEGRQVLVRFAPATEGVSVAGSPSRP